MKKMKRLQDFEEWQQMEKRLIEIQQQITATDQEYQEQLNGLIAQRQQRWAERLEAEASAMLDGTPPPVTIEEQQLRNVERRLRVLRRAEAIHRQRMIELRSELSKTIAKQVQPEYATLVRDLARAAAALAKLVEKEQQFREELKQGDISFVGTFPPCPLRGFGTLREDHSRVSHFIKEAVREKYLNPSEVEVWQ